MYFFYTFEENVQLKPKKNLIKLYIKPLKKGCEEYEIIWI